MQANYLRDLPLHSSQKEIERNKEYSIFQLYLSPTYDFQQEILRNGSFIEILSPQWLREEMKEQIKILYDKYFNNSITSVKDKKH